MRKTTASAAVGNLANPTAGCGVQQTRKAGAQRAVGVVRNDKDGPHLSIGILRSKVELRFNWEVGAPVTSVEGHL